MAGRIPADAIAGRPSLSFDKREGEKLEVKTQGRPMMVYISNCKSCEVLYNEKAAKLTFHNCADMVVRVNSSIICGTLELIGCKNVKIDVQQHGKINTLQTDDSHSVNIGLLTHAQLESVYHHQSSNIEVCVGVKNPNQFHVTTSSCDSAESPQYTAYWKDEGGKLDLVCEKVIREGVYPTTETKLKEAKDRTERDMEKMANALIAGVTVTKPKKNK